MRVLARLAVDLTNRTTGTSQRARLLADGAIAFAGRLADPAQLAIAHWARFNARAGVEELPQRLDDANRLIEWAERCGDPLFAAWGYIHHLLSLLEAGNVAGADRSLASLERLRDRAHLPYVAQRAAACRGMLDLALGRYASAAGPILRAREFWQSGAPPQHRAQEYVLLRDLGRLKEFGDEFVVPDDFHVWRQAAQAHRMALALDRGERDAAHLDYQALLVTNTFRRATIDTWSSVVTRLAEAAIAFHDAASASRLYESMLPAADRTAVDGRLVLCHGPVALYLGQLAAAIGRPDDAEGHLDRSLAISERLGLRPFFARTLLAQARLRAGRNRPGDRRAARGLAQRALDEAIDIGMRGLELACRDLLATLTPRPDGRFGLTARELDVLRLLADGLTDAAIADRFSLSPRTVNTHLTSICGKLDVSSRLAAAQVAGALDLI
ncbi:MAG TPA: LuxR C-terminal-related transcriptional regulator [Thermomicrobiales bacterium]